MSTGSSSAHLALHQAADRDDVAALKDEILQGADVQAQSRGYQETPLHRASYAGAAGCVAELLRARADLNAKRAGGFTALHLAETVEVAKLLLDAGADRSIRANNGKTAMEHCAGGERVQEFISEHVGPNRSPSDPALEPGSPSDMDDEMLRRARMTRKFTQLREKMADEVLQPDFGEATAEPEPEPASDSPPHLDAWLRGHLASAGEAQPEPPPESRAAERDDEDKDDEQDRYESDEFEKDDDEQDDGYESDDFEEFEDEDESAEGSDEDAQAGRGQGRADELRGPRPVIEGAADLLRAAARGEMPAPLAVGDGDAAAPVSPDRDGGPGVPPMGIPISQSSPSSSLSSPDHPGGGGGGNGGGGDPIAPLLAMLAQIRAVRGQTLAAVERLAPHMPEVVNIAAGLEEEAAGLQAAFNQLLGAAPPQQQPGGIPLAQRQQRQQQQQPGEQRERAAGVAAQLLQPLVAGDEDGEDDDYQEQSDESGGWVAAPAEPSVSIDVLASGFRVTEPIPVDETITSSSTTAAAAAEDTDATAEPSASSNEEGAKAAAALLPAGGQGVLLGGLDAARDEAVRDLCSHVVTICTKQEFDLDAHVNPHGFSIPAFGHQFEHVVLEIADSPLAGPLVDPRTRKFAPLLEPVFEAIDAWVEASRGWTVGGLQKRLLIHSVHGCSRPAAVLCAWMMSRGAGKVALADALRAVQGMQPSAAPNFGFIAQLLEHEHLWAAQRTPRPSGPSICVWEYAGLAEDEWNAELARSKQPGVLDRTSARRILAASRRRRREKETGGTEVSVPVPVPAQTSRDDAGSDGISNVPAPGRPNLRINLDPAAVSDAAIMSALGGGGGEADAGGANELPIDAQDGAAADASAAPDLDVAWSREQLDAALNSISSSSSGGSSGGINWAEFVEVD